MTEITEYGKKERCRVLSGLFIADVSPGYGRSESYRLKDARAFTGLALIQAAEYLGCKPDELFIEGEESGGGCGTCGYGGEPVIGLEVRRKP